MAAYPRWDETAIEKRQKHPSTLHPKDVNRQCFADGYANNAFQAFAAGWLTLKRLIAGRRVAVHSIRF
jgi:hypothetical protein